jgi:hypothetical protein
MSSNGTADLPAQTKRRNREMMGAPDEATFRSVCLHVDNGVAERGATLDANCDAAARVHRWTSRADRHGTLVGQDDLEAHADQAFRNVGASLPSAARRASS